MFDVHKVRKDFPVLNNNPELVYLDSTATSLKPQSVIDAMVKYYEYNGATVHRGAYSLSHIATNLYDEARMKIAKYINSPSERQIVFTRGTTTSLNMIALGYAMKFIEAGDEIVISMGEHHSNYIPWQNVAEKKGAIVKYIPLNEKGEITIENAKQVITNKTKIVSCAHISNVLGNIAPIKELTSLAHSVGAIMIVDAAQSAPHLKLDVIDIDCDFLAFSGHKMFAPTGIGILYGKMDLLTKMDPIEFGGDMSDIVTSKDISFKEVPLKFEAGTPMISQVIGFGAAIDYIESIGIENIHQYELELKKYAVEQLSKIDNIIIYNAHNEVGMVTFNIQGIHAHDIVSILDRENICVRAGHHCAQPIHEFLGCSSTLRASFYVYTTKEDIDKLVEATKKGDDFLDVLFQ